jgi:hypothetical protein
MKGDILALSAVSLGVFQLMVSFRDLLKTDNVESYSVPYISLGLLSSSLWITYQYKKGANYSVIYSSLVFAIQLYILSRLLSKAKTREKRDPRA